MIYGKEVKVKVLDGADKLSRAVGSTLGPSGKNVMLFRGGASPHVTKDGVTVSKDVFSDDPYEQMVMDTIRQAAANTGTQAGDGTTTSTILVDAIVRESFNLLARVPELSVHELRRQIDEATKYVMGVITGAPITTEEIYNTCMISSNGDTALSAMVADVLRKVGADGLVHVERSFDHKDSVEFTDGISINSGLQDPVFVTDARKQIAELNNPLILLSEDVIKMGNQINQAVLYANAQRRPLLIIGASLEGLARLDVTAMKRQGFAEVFYVDTPGLGVWMKELLEDLSIACNAEPLCANAHVTIENADVGVVKQVLGGAEKVVISRNRTLILKPYGNKGKIAEHIQVLTASMEEADNPVDKAHIRGRIANLNGNIATVKIGGSTETELMERFDRADDTIHAARAAMQEGIVAGGGMALYKAAAGMDTSLPGFKVLQQAMMYPAARILENAGADISILTTILSSDEWAGYDAFAHRLGNMREMGILDPAMVVKTALKNAVSAAGTLMTCDCMIYH